jgi:hypothetical protein
MKLGFTGSQNPPTDKQRHRLFLVLYDLYDHGYTTMNNGDCIGSDDVAYKLFRGIGDVPGNAVRIIGHPPDLNKKRAFNKYDFEYEVAPYLVRNRRIVATSAVLVATPDGFTEKQRSGTWSTIRYARQQKVARIIVWPDGSVTTEG